MPTIEAESIYEYLRIISTLTEGGLPLWYRGSASLDYGLLPSLYWRKQAKWEGNFVHNFLVRYRAYVPEPITNPWELYALMRHHGLPTRLLDWSWSPLNALFFALTQDPDLDTNRVVWVLPPYEFNEHTVGCASIFCPAGLASRSVRLSKRRKLNLDSYLPQALDQGDNYKLPRKPIAIESPLSRPRIKAQQGCFTIHGALRQGLEKQFTRKKAPFLAAVVLKTRGNLKAFLGPLLSWGINEETVYQDLDSMTRNILRIEGLA